jgi:hypothetical protein
MVLQILEVIAAAGTVGTTLLPLFRPSLVTGFVGLRPEGPRGIIEVRAVFRGLLVGMGGLPTDRAGASDLPDAGRDVPHYCVRAAPLNGDRRIDRTLEPHQPGGRARSRNRTVPLGRAADKSSIRLDLTSLGGRR